jgi:hypothetical protein
MSRWEGWRAPKKRREYPKLGLAPEHGHGRWRVVILEWHPTPLNVLINARHFWAKTRRKDEDAKIVFEHCKYQVGPEPVTCAIGPREVRLIITLAPKQRAGDPDNYWKSLLDALKKCGAIKDDNRQWCRPISPPTFERGKFRSTVIELCDVGLAGKALT